jgi:AcrR family transcriptional regulator
VSRRPDITRADLVRSRHEQTEGNSPCLTATTIVLVPSTITCILMFEYEGASMTSATTRQRTEPKRADARKNIEAILEAATICLARDPDASINSIAQTAGVGRVTLYGHFESRSALIAAVASRAMQQTNAALEGIDLGGDPRAALVRLLTASWELTHRFGALVVAAVDALPADELRDAHAEPAERVERLLRRGRRAQCFRADMPLAWQITTIQGVLHAASAAVHRGEITAAKAPKLVCDTVIAALTPPGTPVPD